MQNSTKKGLIRYSESFKQQVVNELLKGKHKTPREASAYYGINGRQTVRNWCISYGYEHLLSRRIKIETMKEIDEKNN